jgi:hypothetical protein
LSSKMASNAILLQEPTAHHLKTLIESFSFDRSGVGFDRMQAIENE